MRKYIFTGPDVELRTLPCYEVTLQDEASIQEIDQMLWDFYEQWAMVPEYLLLSMEDLVYLSRSIVDAMRDLSASTYLHRYFAESDAIEDLSSVQNDDQVRRVFPGGGGSLPLIVLPGLQSGRVILIFTKKRF